MVSNGVLALSSMRDEALGSSLRLWVENLETDLASCNLAQSDHRWLILVAFDMWRSAGRDLPGAIGRSKRQLKAVRDTTQTIVDCDSCHTPITLCC